MARAHEEQLLRIQQAAAEGEEAVEPPHGIGKDGGGDGVGPGE